MANCEQESETHIYFYGGAFSNFAYCPSGVAVVIGDELVAFRTSEHAFMALKAHEFEDIDAIEQLKEAVRPSDDRSSLRRDESCSACQVHSERESPASST